MREGDEVPREEGRGHPPYPQGPLPALRVCVFRKSNQMGETDRPKYPYSLFPLIQPPSLPNRTTYRKGVGKTNRSNLLCRPARKSERLTSVATNQPTTTNLTKPDGYVH